MNVHSHSDHKTDGVENGLCGSSRRDDAVNVHSHGDDQPVSRMAFVDRAKMTRSVNVHSHSEVQPVSRMGSVDRANATL